MIYKMIIPGKLPGLNEIVDENRRNMYKGARLKAETEEFIEWQIRLQLQGVRINGPVVMRYLFAEPDARRDWDNVVSGAVKVIQDALVKQGVLPNDGQKWVREWYPRYAIDKVDPRIEVEIEEVS